MVNIPNAVNRILNDLRKWNEHVYKHSINVSRIVNRLVDMYQKEYGGISNEEHNLIVEAGLLHDVGKLMISPAILSYEGKLDSYMYKIIKKHCEYGEAVLRNYGYTNEYVIKAVVQHHERCDGSGYPAGLKNDEIILGAKFIAVADSFDALISYRPYKNVLSPDLALNKLLSQSYYYDNKILKCLFKLVNGKGGITSVK